MSLRDLSISLVLIGCIGATAQTGANAGKEGFGIIIFCEDLRAVTTWPSGVSLISLSSRQAEWKAIQDKIVDVGPAVAGSTVAIVTDTWGTIYGFSKETGKLLWKKKHHSNVLGSDGRYIYAFRVEQDGRLLALDPESGNIAWSVEVGQHGPADFLSVHGSLLFTDSFVVDLKKRAVVHKWPADPVVNSVSVAESGEILAGDSSGGITTYDKKFKRLGTIHVRDGVIVEAVRSGNEVLAATYQHRAASKQGALTLITQDGKPKWEREWTSEVLLAQPPFTLLREDALIIEPGSAGNWRRLTSRKLSSGDLNWTTEDGDFQGPPVVCGDGVYVYERERIRIFGARDGIERTSVGAERHRLESVYEAVKAR